MRIEKLEAENHELRRDLTENIKKVSAPLEKNFAHCADKFINRRDMWIQTESHEKISGENLDERIKEIEG